MTGRNLNAPGTKGLRVLVVEDEFLIAIHLEETLRQLGCVPIGPAFTLEGGFALAHATTLDGALLDLNLCGKSAMPLAESLKQLGVPIAFITAYELDRLESSTLEGVAWIHKPFTADQVHHLVSGFGATHGDKFGLRSDS